MWKQLVYAYHRFIQSYQRRSLLFQLKDLTRNNTNQNFTVLYLFSVMGKVCIFRLQWPMLRWTIGNFCCFARKVSHRRIGKFYDALCIGKGVMGSWGLGNYRKCLYIILCTYFSIGNRTCLLPLSNWYCYCSMLHTKLSFYEKFTNMFYEWYCQWFSRFDKLFEF